MGAEAAGYLVRQFDTAWKLLGYHLETLSTEECLWRPAARGLHVQRGEDGTWRADWPEHEGYGLGPSSIGWLGWHLLFWWNMVRDHSFGEGQLTREQIVWPGSAEALRAQLRALHDDWRAQLLVLDDEALAASERTRWPMRERPFGDVVAWATLELTKSAAEIGYVRFLYTQRPSHEQDAAR